MVRKINSELLPLTRELAQKFAQMEPLPGERKLKQFRLADFRAHLKNKTFNSPNWSMAIIPGTEGQWRADGQHTSTVLTTCSDEQFPQNLKVTVNTYELDSLEDAPLVFDLFDNPKSARSNTDKMGVYVIEYPELASIDHGFLAKITRGIDFYYRDLSKQPPQEGQGEFTFHVSRDHGLYFKVNAHREFATWLFSTVHPVNRKPVIHAWMVNKTGIVAEMFIDWKKYGELGVRFWAEVLDETNDDQDAESRTMARQMKDWSKKQPKVNPERFRLRAQKGFDRYRREVLAAKSAETEVVPIPAVVPIPSSYAEAMGMTFPPESGTELRPQL